MATATPLDRYRGRTSGRCQPSAGAVLDDWSFVLGDDLPGRIWDLAVGDHVEVSQALDVTGLSLVTAVVRLRPPAAVAPGRSWVFSWRLDGSPQGSRVLAAGRRSFEYADVAVDVSQVSGTHTVAFRLEVA